MADVKKHLLSVRQRCLSERKKTIMRFCAHRERTFVSRKCVFVRYHVQSERERERERASQLKCLSFHVVSAIIGNERNKCELVCEGEREKDYFSS